MAKHHLIFDSQTFTTEEACPRKHDLIFHRNLKRPGGKNNSFECGSLAHFILETYYRSWIAGYPKSECISRAFEAGKEYLLPWTELCVYVKDKKHPGLQNTPEESDNSEKKRIIGWTAVFSTMEEYFDFYKNDSFTPLHVEHVMGKLLYEDDDIAILWKAKMDLIADTNAGNRPMDHKTGKQREDPVSLNNQFMGQCFILGTRTMWVNQIVFASTLKPAEKFRRLPMNYSADRIEEWRTEIVPHYARMYLAYKE